MKRSPRTFAAGDILHITARSIHGNPLFADDRDHDRFTLRFGAIVLRMRWLCVAYCWMTTHYHFVIQTAEDNVSDGMQRLNFSHALWMNRRHGRRGRAFGARYNPEPVRRDAHLAEVARYVDLNPPRAGICAHPLDWRCSGYRATIGVVRRPRFHAPDLVLEQFSANRRRAQQLYAEFVRAGMDIPLLDVAA